jgi:hypothetical protein
MKKFIAILTALITGGMTIALPTLMFLGVEAGKYGNNFVKIQ